MLAEGEPPAEGEIVAEGEGENEASSCCGNSEKTLTIREFMNRTLGDWLLFGMSLLVLTALTPTRK